MLFIACILIRLRSHFSQWNPPFSDHPKLNATSCSSQLVLVQTHDETLKGKLLHCRFSHGRFQHSFLRAGGRVGAGVALELLKFRDGKIMDIMGQYGDPAVLMCSIIPFKGRGPNLGYPQSSSSHHGWPWHTTTSYRLTVVNPWCFGDPHFDAWTSDTSLIPANFWLIVAAVTSGFVWE